MNDGVWRYEIGLTLALWSPLSISNSRDGRQLKNIEFHSIECSLKVSEENIDTIEYVLSYL